MILGTKLLLFFINGFLFFEIAFIAYVWNWWTVFENYLVSGMIVRSIWIITSFITGVNTFYKCYVMVDFKIAFGFVVLDNRLNFFQYFL